MRAVVVFLINFNVVLYFVTGQQIYQNALPLGLRTKTPRIFAPATIFRERRADTLEHHVIDSTQDCIKVTVDDGHFYYKAPNDEPSVCGIYMITEPNKRIEMTFTFMDVPCGSGGLVQWVDGWELNGEFFPVPSDHSKSMDDRVEELCGTKRVKKVFLSDQNVALLAYKIPVKGKGFSIRVRHVKNPTPCNILLQDTEDVFTIRNYGKASNCSLTAIFPASVQVMALSVGVEVGPSSKEIETGTISKCDKRGMSDYVSIGGGAVFSATDMIRGNTVCGMDSLAAEAPITIFCDVVNVRMMSSGQYTNSITIAIKKLGVEDINPAALICPM